MTERSATVEPTTTHRYHRKRDELLARMRRVEGQARGIARMIEDDRYCPDIVQQLSAMSSAADEVALILLQEHIEGCVADAIRSEESEPKIRELMSVLRKAMKR